MNRPLLKLVVTALIAASPAFALAQQKVLKFIPQADLRILDPIATTAYITRNHGYMVYDTLFAIDEKFQVQPQMVDKWRAVSKDKLTYTFTLRDGLKFHDGQPVRSADCIASIERWAQARRARPEARRGDRRRGPRSTTRPSRLKLKKPFPLTLGGARQACRRTCRSSCRSASPRPMPFKNIDGPDRLGAVQVREGRMGAGQQGRLRQEHRLRAAQGAAVVGRRRQGRESRPRRMDLHPRFGDRGRRAERGRSRLVGAAAARSDPAAAQEQGHHASRTSTRSARWA